MTMAKRWRVECDAEGCEAVQVSAQASKSDAGTEFNDYGWQAGPGTRRTYCAEHWLSDEEWKALLLEPPLLEPFGAL